MGKGKLRIVSVLGVLAAAAAIAAAAFAVASTGPSSGHSPYVVPSRSDVDVVSLLTVGDNVSGGDSDGPGYQMVGIPDGLGAYRNGDGTFTVLMNHELRTNEGLVRDHGAIGAFVSKWTVDADTLEVTGGDDLIQEIVLAPGGVYGAPQKGVVLGRLCSGDLAAPSAFDHAQSGKGFPDRLYLNGEENGTEGRAFAHGLGGTSWELPFLGKMNWENVVAHPSTGDTTVVVGLDDSTPGQVYVYVGEKRREGNPVERAGLVGGKLYGVKVEGYPAEPTAGIPAGTPFELVEIPSAHLKTGAAIDSESRSKGVTDFKRPEDGSWNPTRHNEFYWVTTDKPNASGGTSRLWRLNFTNSHKPEKGGTIEMLLDGSEGQNMMDNITVDSHGRVLIDEDPGNDPIASRIWSYEIKSGELRQLAVQKQAHGPEPSTAYTGYATNDEEVSGIIPADEILGPGWYLFDSQIHEVPAGQFPNAVDKQKLVEKGQLLALHYPVGG